MKRAFLGPITLVLASCGMSGLSPESRRQVPLIKAERFDEAASAGPRHLAPAFVTALRQLKADEADPKRIIAVADYFFDHYPFAIEDLAIDEAIFEAVADAHHAASIQLVPALDSCWQLEAARTFVDKANLLRTWKGLHRDGGRCARGIRRSLDRALNLGENWDFDFSLTGERPDRRLGFIDEQLVEACFPLFLDQPHMVTIVFAKARLAALWNHSPSDDWNRLHELAAEARWTKLHKSRLAWLAALRHRPYFDLIDDIAPDLIASPFDPRLRDLGAALKAWGEAIKPIGSKDPVDPEKVRETADGVIRHGAGTPFPDVARYSRVAAQVQSKQLEAAERSVRDLRPQFSRVFLACHGLLEAAGLGIAELENIRSPEEALHLAREVYAWDPAGPTAGLTWIIQARVHAIGGRDREKIECLESAMRVPGTPAGIEDASPDVARSEAGRGLVRHYTARRDWSRALEAWKAWQSYTECVTCSWSQQEETNLGIAGCLEKLGHSMDAADYYWDAATGQGTKTVEAARKVKEIYSSKRRILDLVARVKSAVHSVLSNGWKVEGGLRWLADDLKVPVR